MLLQKQMLLLILFPHYSSIIPSRTPIWIAWAMLQGCVAGKRWRIWLFIWVELWESKCGIIFWVNALKVIDLATMSTQASWKYVNLFKVLYGIYTHLWFKGCSVYIIYFFIFWHGVFFFLIKLDLRVFHWFYYFYSFFFFDK